ncbi:MAG: hypothetical protein FJZ13_00790 [Candidatus Omnitrophica bacterium]|nr:hypothetical protein [Candidatus Omnitrophota bacterium]
MKIFILYTSAGSGHFKAAQALYDYFKNNNPHLEIRLIDILENSLRPFRNAYTSSYAFMVSYVQVFWAIGYYVTHFIILRPVVMGIRFIINRINTFKFSGFLAKENPDIIICTHFLPVEVATHLKRRRKINSRLFTVVTDFGIHPFWLSKFTDIYIVASNFTRQQLVRRGIKESRVKVTGIPIEQKFSRQFPRGALLRKFNLEDRFTVLIVTGSFGIGPIDRIVDLLRRDVQVLVVSARNKALFDRLRRKNYPGVSVFGFVDNIEELMAISDLIITKPGGLTISEVLAMELVPIFISAIPGQEAANIEILKGYGIGLCAKDNKEVKELVLDYKEHPEKLNKIKENMRRIKKPDALREIYNVVCPGGPRNTG